MADSIPLISEMGRGCSVLVSSLLLLLLLANQVLALDNGIARTPPMGWRSWEAFYGDVDEAKLLATFAALTDKSRNGLDGKPISLAELGFNDAGLDSGFQDCAARTVGGKPSWHGANGSVLVNAAKFPSGLGALVHKGHVLGLTVSWYGNACACHDENSYTATTSPTIQEAMAGTVADTIRYGFDGLKLDSCSQFNNMSEWARLLNSTGKPVLLENCHQGGLVPGQKMPGQETAGATTFCTDAASCPYHVYRSSDDSYNSWENAVNNINSITPYLTQSEETFNPRSRPGMWAYPDMLETANYGCKSQKSGCLPLGPPIEDRSQFAMWAIVSSPLILSFDMTSPHREVMDRVWPIISNVEVIAVNQAWHGSPGQLLLMDHTVYPSTVSAAGYYTYPGRIGQSRGWQDIRGMTDSDNHGQVGPCVDPWGSATCPHYMTLHRANMTLDDADAWCNEHTKCHGFTYATNSTPEMRREVYFRDETQVFFMDSQVKSALVGPVGNSTWTSHIKKARAPPLSPSTSGIQIWVKDLGVKGGLALVLVNLGQEVLTKYSLPLSRLPSRVWREGGGEKAALPTKARDLYTHSAYEYPIADGALTFQEVAPHDSVFLILSCP
tara:strand:- start:42 stop:1874 length:1833 start_codon:yes stop_codon:yes gene_type:complete